MSLPASKIEIPQKEVYTHADYALLPEGASYQLIGGKLIMTPAPTTYHQGISMRLELKLATFVIEKDLGMVYYAPVDVYLEETENYQPDIIYISKDRLHIIEPAMVKGAPDLIIEILSPSTAYYDLREKFKVYARHGVKEYWIVDPHEQSIEVYRGEEGEFKQIQRVEKEGKVQSVVLRCFEVEIKDIFVKLPV